ncbi:hypothetical protein M407DRAFT_90442 [Tulasnella calospora MUT 4182]|uniref:Uncharacterized protein n=1 Tax=Tulasnella calospora MUT 4182 TaxID=1051891 RepID=A0A0C3QZG6_9AGAM|nr:hypothetical protein M407DRAFT_90442 [Tulasnella calospora MUT 4182]
MMSSPGILVRSLSGCTNDKVRLEMELYLMRQIGNDRYESGCNSFKQREHNRRMKRMDDL